MVIDITSPLRTAPPRPCPARIRLRAATAGPHAEVDGLFPQGLDSAHSYRRYVLGMHRFAVDYEIAIGALPRHSAWLARDLASHSLLPLAAAGVRRPLADAASRLGWEYVFAGSSMGARRLLRDAQRLGYGQSHGAHFLARHAASLEWTALQARLEALDPDDGVRMARAEQGALDAFSLVRTCFGRSFDRIPDVSTREGP